MQDKLTGKQDRFPQCYTILTWTRPRLPVRPRQRSPSQSNCPRTGRKAYRPGNRAGKLVPVLLWMVRILVTKFGGQTLSSQTLLNHLISCIFVSLVPLDSIYYVYHGSFSSIYALLSCSTTIRNIDQFSDTITLVGACLRLGAHTAPIDGDGGTTRKELGSLLALYHHHNYKGLTMPRGIPNAKKDDTGFKYTAFHVPLMYGYSLRGSIYAMLTCEAQTKPKAHQLNLPQVGDANSLVQEEFVEREGSRGLRRRFERWSVSPSVACRTRRARLIKCEGAVRKSLSFILDLGSYELEKLPM